MHSMFFGSYETTPDLFVIDAVFHGNWIYAREEALTSLALLRQRNGRR